MKQALTKAAACLLTMLLCLMSLAAMPVSAADTAAAQASANALSVCAEGETGIKENLTAHTHVAASIMGDETTSKTFYKGMPYYLVFTLKKSDGTIWNASNFTTTFTVNDPSGAQVYTYSYNAPSTYNFTGSDITMYAGYCCIVYTPSAVGTYKYTVTLSGDVTTSVSSSFTVKEFNFAINIWNSDTPMGDSSGGITTPFASGTKIYCCYKLYDKDTSEPVGDTIYGYTVTILQTTPDGSDLNPIVYDDTMGFPEGYSVSYNWGSVTAWSTGKWHYSVTLTGNLNAKSEKDFFVGTYEAFVYSESSTIGDGKFIWGQDNWQFRNEDKYYTTGYDVDSKTMDAMLNAFPFSNIDREFMYMLPYAASFEDWGGSCYGATYGEIYAKQGLLSPADFGLNAVINKNSNTPTVLSFINFLYHIQDVPLLRQLDRQAAVRRTTTQDPLQGEYIKALEKAVSEQDTLVNLCYAIQYLDDSGAPTSTSGHSVLAYGRQTGTFYIGGKLYNRRILIADPNWLDDNALNDQACLYYSSSDYSWCIPYQNTSSKACRWDAADGPDKKYGYIKNIIVNTDLGDAHDPINDSIANAESYYAGIRIFNDDMTDVKIYKKSVTDSSKVPESAFFEDDAASPAKSGKWWLSSPQAAYEVYDGQKNADGSYPARSYEFMMDYKDAAYLGKLENVKDSYYHPAGYVEYIGDNMTYSINMVANDSAMVTDWYSFTVSGSGVDHLSYKKVDEGYVLTLDKAAAIRVEAHNTTDTATPRTLRALYSSFLFYEINPTTIGIRVDADNNGTFETWLDKVTIAGDVDQNGKLELADAVLLHRYLNEDTTLTAAAVKKLLSDNALADINKDDQITIIDLRQLLKALGT